jgi:hypothetical protein
MIMNEQEARSHIGGGSGSSQPRDVGIRIARSPRERQFAIRLLVQGTAAATALSDGWSAG